MVSCENPMENKDPLSDDQLIACSSQGRLPEEAAASGLGAAPTMGEGDYEVSLLTTPTKRTQNCKFCNKQFVSKYHLMQHMKKHSGELAQSHATKDNVGESLKTNYLLTKHTDGEKIIEFDQCESDFSEKTNYESHRETLSRTKLDFINQFHMYNNKLHVSHTEHAYAQVYNENKIIVNSEAKTLDIRVENPTQEINLTGTCKDFGGLGNKNTHENFSSCNVCGKLINGEMNLYEHMKIHIGKKPFKCSMCQKRYRKKCNLTRHLLKHTENWSYKCDVCDRVVSTKSNLKTHQKMHDKGISSTRQSENDENLGRCHMCGKEITSEVGLEQHMRTHTEEKSFKCDQCGKYFKLKHTLKVHMLIHTGCKPHKCDVCGKDFIQVSNLRTHQKTHRKMRSALKFTPDTTILNICDDARPYGCKVCGDRFTEILDLNQHADTHTEEMPYGCATCQENFKDSASFDAHMKRHCQPEGGASARDKNTASCNLCGKSISNKTQLVQHLRVHTGEKPYECGHCGIRFRQKGHLNSHVLRHTGEKPHECNVCKKKFIQKTHFKRHLLFAHNKNKS